MRNLQYSKDGKTYKQVSKTKARRLYNEGKPIALVPSNLYPLAPMVGFSVMSVNDIDEQVRDEKYYSFDSRVNSFEYYNCTCNETGKYANFFEIV